MATFLVATLLFLVVFAAMAVGVIFSNKPIKGSCGGLNNIGLGSGECEICGGNRDKCDEANGRKQDDKPDNASLAYDATRKS
jgi:uncharacterized protein